MANTVQIKRSGTASATPASLSLGELAINYADGKAFYKNASNAIVAVPLSLSASDKILGRSSAGPGAIEEITCTSFARSLLTSTDAAAARTTLGVSGGSSSVNKTLCQGRLTLETGVAVSTTDQTAKGTLYFTPYKGNSVALYISGAWVEHTFTEVTRSLSGLTSGKNYDVFFYDNNGTKALTEVQWTDDTTRSSALAVQDGVLVRSGSTHQRYVGTFRTSAVGQTEDTESSRLVFNYYNQVPRRLYACPGYSNNSANNTYTVSSTTWVQANSGTGNKLQVVLGDAQDVPYTVCAMADATAGEFYMAVGVNTTSTASVICGLRPNQSSRGLSASRMAALGAGFRTLYMITRVTAGTATVYADGTHSGGDVPATFLVAEVVT